MLTVGKFGLIDPPHNDVVQTHRFMSYTSVARRPSDQPRRRSLYQWANQWAGPLSAPAAHKATRSSTHIAIVSNCWMEIRMVTLSGIRWMVRSRSNAYRLELFL